MTCRSLIQSGKVVGHLCGPTTKEERQLRKRRRTKWCFACRKKLPHMLTALVELTPSYYDPVVFWKCSGCGKDETLFPGWFYE